MKLGHGCGRGGVGAVLLRAEGALDTENLTSAPVRLTAFTLMGTHTHTHVQTHMCTCTQTHTCVHMLAHTRVQACSRTHAPGQAPRCRAWVLVLVRGLAPATRHALNCPPTGPRRPGLGERCRACTVSWRLARRAADAGSLVTRRSPHSCTGPIPDGLETWPPLQTPPAISAPISKNASTRRSKG